NLTECCQTYKHVAKHINMLANNFNNLQGK
ncbi:MAG: hypothetical protein ACI9VI_002601, partial [Candidatus Azotimanducaceae bacterium]